MNILFVTFEDLSVGAGSIRSVSILRALADAGNQVDVIASASDLEPHANIHVLVGDTARRTARRTMRRAIRRALRTHAYHILHAVDEAAMLAVQIVRSKRTSLVYQASRCFTGANGEAPSWFWKLFPTYAGRIERKILRRARMILSSCGELSHDLKKIRNDARVIEIQDVPAQCLFARKEEDRNAAVAQLDGDVSFLVVCCVLPANQGQSRTLLLAARKVIDKIPRAAFVFKGLVADKIQPMAVNLDIQGRCLFLAEDEPERFLSVLSIADAALFVPTPGCRYRRPEILTLLNSPALVVAIQERAYASVLTERNSCHVDYTATSIAEGLLRVVHEPLLAFGVVADAQQQIADGHSFSSFKHKIRMAYHDLAGA